MPTTNDLKPSDYLLRKEMAYAVMRLRNSNASDYVTTGFTDVPYGMEYAGAVKWANQRGLMSGTSQTTFAPNNNITRQEVCLVLCAYFDYFGINVPVVNDNISYTDFPDGGNVSSYAVTAVNRMLRAGIIEGGSDGNLAPKSPIKRSQISVILTNAHALSYNTLNSINLYVRDEDGNTGKPILYAYHPRYTSPMYPEYPALGANGMVRKNGLNVNTEYAVNVMQKYPYDVIPLNDYLSPSYKYIFVTIPQIAQNPDDYRPPLNDFKAKNSWPHDASSLVCRENLATELCDSFCSEYSGDFEDGKCPHGYMNVQTPQNFGWRYDANSQYEFHQGVDITRLTNGNVTSSTPVYSIFNNDSTVKIREYRPETGNTVQIRWGWEYVTYMHLSSFNSSLPHPNASDNTCPAGLAIGTVGNTGISSTGTHLHIQVCNYATIYPDSPEARDTFLNPLRFFSFWEPDPENLE